MAACMKRKTAGFFICLISVFLLSTADSEAKEFYRIGQDYRAMAMGNTGITTANNSSALFYNPAAMSNIFSWWVDFPGMQFYYSDNWADAYDRYQNGIQLETQSEIFSFMEDFLGDNYYLRVDAAINAFFNMDKKGFTIGANYTYEYILDFSIRNAAAPEVDYLSRLDLIKQAGFSYPIGLGQFVIGITFKQIDRNELLGLYTYNDALNETEFPDFTTVFSGGGDSGSGTGYDIGFVYRTSTAAHITYGAVWRSEVLLGDATKIPSQVDLGISLRQESLMFRWILAMDIKDVLFALEPEGDETSRSYMRRLHYGTEIGIFPIDKTSSFLSIRAGYNQGYLTYGAEMTIYHYMNIGYTKYTEEIGEYSGQRGSDRTVWYLSFAF